VRTVLVALLAGCSFQPKGESPPDAPAQATGSIVEDVATDFTGTVTGGEIDPLGLITPDTYVANGLHARGFKKNGILNTTDLDNLPDLGPSSGEVYGMPITGNWPNNADPNKLQSQFPLALGIGQGDNYSVLYDGEIQLAAGATQLKLSVDDDAVFEIDVGGTKVKLAAVVNADTTTTVTVPADGWYPIRGAYSENGGDARLSLSIVDTSTTPFPANRLRARTTATHGAMMGVCFASELQLGMLDFIAAGPGYEPGPIDHKPLVPLDYKLTTQWSIRYQAQLRVDADDMYTIGASVGSDADDHYRVFVDGALVASHWLTITDVAPAPTHLAPGWHALIVDYGQNTGNAEVHVTIDGAPVAADHLRPTLTRGRAIATSPGFTPCAFNTGGTDCPVGVTDTSPGATIDYLDVEYAITGPRDITPTLKFGSRTDVLPIHTPAANETEFGATKAFDYEASRAGFAGANDVAPWSMHVDAPTIGGSLLTFAVLTTYGGPGAPFAPAVTYESMPHDLPDGATLDAVTVTGKLDSTTVIVEVRTAADSESLAAAAYVPVGNGMPLAMPAGKLVQFRVSTSTDGWTFPEIDKIEVDFTAP
jgi:hypothetical protein